MRKGVAVSVPAKCEWCEEPGDVEPSGYTPETPNYARVCLLSASEVRDRSVVPTGVPARHWKPGQQPKPEEYRPAMLCESCKATDDGENSESVLSMIGLS